jgi:hypothetical protein
MGYLMLFSLADKVMNHTKNMITSEWDPTDLGEPRKIVSIEITIKDDSIKMSQQKYLKSLLQKEGMADANPVGMPLDPNIKLMPDPENNQPNQSNAYVKLLGTLQYVYCQLYQIRYSLHFEQIRCLNC